MNCIIIDDEPLARELIKSYIEKTPDLNLLGSYESGAAAIKSIMSEKIDIVFLDINMPMLNGIELARVIPNHSRIIYITAYEQYALQGFKANALDYLLKPVNFAEFTRAIAKAAEWVAMRDAYEAQFSGQSAISKQSSGTGLATTSLINPSSSGQDIHRTSNNGFITIRSESRIIQMRTDSILYIEVQNDRIVFQRKDADPVISLISMKEIEELLPADRFMRVHRSFIVNLDNIEIVERNRIIFGKIYIPIADSRREEFFARFTTR